MMQIMKTLFVCSLAIFGNGMSLCTRGIEEAFTASYYSNCVDYTPSSEMTGSVVIQGREKPITAIND